MSTVKKAASASLLIGLACTVMAAFGPALAVAKPQRATLTHTEYKLLTKTLAGVKKALFGKDLDLTLGYSSCKADGSSTALMRSERAECGDEVAMYEQFQQVDVTVSTCGVRYASTTTTTTPTTTGTTTTGTTTTGTTTTGTTTTGTTSIDGFSSSGLATIACMNPAYQRVTRDIEAMSAATALNHQRAAARGFTGTCLSNLAGPAKLITDERQFAAAAKQIAKDYAVLSELSGGRSPSHVPTNSQLTSDGLAFQLTSSTYTQDATPTGKLTGCLHD
jgi:hypothetical protein